MSNAMQATTSEAEWKTERGEVAGNRLSNAFRLGIAAAALLILSVLPLQAQTETVLHSFSGGPTDGGTPSGSLVRDGSGNLYGTTQIGGASGFGTVFELVASENFKEKELYSFGATSGDGQLPVTGLVVDGNGNLFGTTQTGGGSTACQFGCGTVFELVNSSGSYTEKVLYSFTGSEGGQSPGALLIDASGNLYGTTVFGGTSKSTTLCKTGCGIVFELANNSGSYTYSVLYNFLVTGGDGISPEANLVMDSAGNLYGTTGAGGIAATGCLIGCGTVFELVKGSGGYTETLPPLYSFTGIPDGYVPGNLVIQEVSGNIFLYGSAGGGTSTACLMGCGIVFELDNSSGTFKKSLLYSFAGSPDVQGGSIVAIDASGNLYGIGGGGDSTACVGCGTVFKLHPNGNGTYAESVLYNFAGSPDGAVPTGLVLDASDDVYGTTGLGGTSTVCGLSGCGTVFEITPGSTGPTIVISATGGSGQAATVNTPFASPLEVLALDSRNQLPVNGLTVTFTAPANGASGTFSGGVDTAVTNTSGIATSNVFTANGTAGSYTVTAGAPNVSGTATFSLTNNPAQIGTMVSVSTSSSDHGDALPSNDALVGNPITVSFKVAPTSGSATPTGSVVVTDGLGDTCTPSPVILTPASAGAGSCTLTITTPPASGTATLKATYTPDTNVFAGNTGSVSESVVEILSCGANLPPELVVKQGATTTYSFTVCIAGNANAVLPVTNVVACVPRGHCTSSITQIGQTGVYTVSVTVSTVCGVSCDTLIVSPPRSSPGPWPLTLLCFGALLAMLMARGLLRQNQARPRLLYAAGILIAILLCGMPGCGSRSSQNETPVGMYTVSVMVAAGNFNVVVPANVMVEK